MTDIDFDLHNIPMLLGANKSKDYQEQIISISNALMCFLKDNNLLINIEPFAENGEVKKDLILRMSNVTPEGLELFKKVIPGWFSYLDKSTKPEKYQNISRLEKGLAKLRESR
ncbi:hypothetical protein ACSLVK_14910 [Photorhabdus tasmaniensis]|uniref:hypothetical protein n=1 Tax=Photorhabdus tasmaniensis TaxID=1004159 RepID=UPI004042AC95